MKNYNQNQPSLGIIIVGIVILILVNMLSALGQTTLLSENFEGSTTSWSYITTSGNGNNYWEVSQGSCSNGSKLLMVRRNNDACTYRNNQAHNIMARRLVNATGYENLTLGFDWICNGQAGADYGSVYYSFNGTTWTQITTGGNGGVYQGTTTWGTQTAYSLPAVLRDTTFYIGFNWVNNNSGGSYPAFGVDNVVIRGTVKPATPPQAPTNTIFSQNFSGGTLPSGWTNTDMTGNNSGTWRFNNPGGRTINTPTAANGFAIFDSDQLGQDNKPENAELVTSAFNCSAYSIVNLSLYHYFYHYANSNYRISISGDNGATYTTLAFDSVTTANAANYLADISAYAAGKSQVRLKFTYRGSYSWYWAVDDILVTGQATDSSNWTGAVSTAWTTAGNWSTGSVPNNATKILIPALAVRMPTVAANAGATAHNITIQAGATLTVATDSAQGGNFTVTGSLTCNGTLAHSGTTPIRLTGAGKTIRGNFAVGANDAAWQLMDGASYTLTGNFTTYQLSIGAGASLALNGHTLSVYALQQSGSLSIGYGTLEVAGNNNVFTASGFNAGLGTVHFNSGGGSWVAKPKVNQTVPSLAYYDLQVRVNNGFTATLGNGAGFEVGRHLTVLNPSTAGGFLATASNIAVQGNLVLGSGSTNGFTFNVGHRVLGGGGSSALVCDGSVFQYQINITYVDASLPAIDNFDGSPDIAYPVAYNGIGTQMVLPATYGSLAIGGTGSKALRGDVTVNRNLMLGSATLTTAVSMAVEKTSASADVATTYVNGGVAANNNVPTLASLASVSNMSITIPSLYANYALVGLKTTINHTYNADLDIYLVSPAGTVYVVSTDNGGNGDGYADARFTDAGTTVFANNAILNGHYRPEGFTFASIGGSKTGTWTLYVVDDADQDDGMLMDFKLELRNGSAFANIEVKGNWINTNGTFTAGTALVTLNGTSQQNVSTRGQVFYQLRVNNAAGVILNEDLTISNALTLSNGVVTTAANRLIITNTGSGSLAAYGPTAFVNGNLRRYIGFNTQTYALPVGNGTTTAHYHLAELENNLLLGVSYIDASFGNLSGHNDADINVTENGLEINRINPAGVWHINPNNQPTLGSYGIKLSLNGFNGLADNDFVILKRPSGSTSGAAWSNGNGLLNLVNGLGRLVSQGFALRTGLTSFSEFGIGDGNSGGTSLPIELVAFTAILNGNGQVQLDGATELEINNDDFTVERSVDGLEFEPVDVVAAAGNSTLMRQYRTLDSEPYDGLSYYRLKQTDFDGTFTYSPMRNILVARSQDSPAISVYPNPNQGRFQLEVAGMYGMASVVVMDLQGRVAYQGAMDLNGQQEMQLDLSHRLMPGFHHVMVQTFASQAMQKIVVE